MINGQIAGPSSAQREGASQIEAGRTNMSSSYLLPCSDAQAQAARDTCKGSGAQQDLRPAGPEASAALHSL